MQQKQIFLGYWPFVHIWYEAPTPSLNLYLFSKLKDYLHYWMNYCFFAVWLCNVHFILNPNPPVQLWRTGAFGKEVTNLSGVHGLVGNKSLKKNLQRAADADASARGSNWEIKDSCFRHWICHHVDLEFSTC